MVRSIDGHGRRRHRHWIAEPPQLRHGRLPSCPARRLRVMSADMRVHQPCRLRQRHPPRAARRGQRSRRRALPRVPRAGLLLAPSRSRRWSRRASASLVPDSAATASSERPADVAAYDIHHLTGDLVGLLDALDIERAVFVGHDWGGLVVWMMPLLHRRARPA